MERDEAGAAAIAVRRSVKERLEAGMGPVLEPPQNAA